MSDKPRVPGSEDAFSGGSPYTYGPVLLGYPNYGQELPGKPAPKVELCQVCNSPSRNPPHPLQHVPVGRRTYRFCHLCEIKVEVNHFKLIQGLRRLNGLPPLPEGPQPPKEGTK